MPITYLSTRGGETGLRFEQVVLGGLAKDKGLYIPESIPKMSIKEIEMMRSMTYSQLAYKVICQFVDSSDIPSENLKDIVNRSFSKFRHDDVTPTIKKDNYWVLELFHGPTFAFKDVALQFLGNIFEYFLEKGNIQNKITILGATSGDTGSAAIHGLRGKKNVNCFILYPTGKVTTIQEKQMTSILDENVQCISLPTDFDGCQAIVKSAFADEDFRNEVKLGAINSINWARVLAQITYYFYSWLRATDAMDPNHIPKLSFVVPTGNFGDILAGYYAKQMGLPVDKLVVATNTNDVLHRFLESGSYRKDPSIVTIAPSMDISVSSNFERYLFYLAGNATTLKRWMDEFESTGVLKVNDTILKKAKEDFSSSSCNEKQIIDTMVEEYQRQSYWVCPHTATAVYAIEKLNLSAPTTICLATAHPAKFEQAVRMTMSRVGVTELPKRPDPLEQLFSMSTRSTTLRASLPSVQAFMRRTMEPSLHRMENALSFVGGSIGADVGAWFDENPTYSWLSTFATLSVLGYFMMSHIQLKNR